MAGQYVGRKKREGERWLVWDGQYFRRLEELNMVDLKEAVNYLSAQDLKEELLHTTTMANKLAHQGAWAEPTNHQLLDKAREYAVVCDFLAEYLANGGDKHG